MKALEFDKNNFIDVVSELAQQKGLTLATLEKEIETSAGYFSRLKNKASNTPPNIDTLRKLAHFFNVPIDILYGANVSKMTKVEIKLMKLFTKILIETRSDIITWQADATQELNYCVDPNFDHVLLGKYTDEEYDPEEGPTHWDMAYKPIVGEIGKTNFDGPCLHYAFDEETEIYISRIKYIYEGEDGERDYEMYSVTNKKSNPVCSTRWTNSKLAILLRMIYDEAMLSRCLILPDEAVKKAVACIDSNRQSNHAKLIKESIPHILSPNDI